MQNTLTKPSQSFRDLWDLVLLVSLAIILAALALWMIFSQSSLGLGSWLEQDPPASDMSQTAFTEETGIRILHVALIAGGGMLDLRYQVVDPDKAVVIHDDDYPPGFLVESTGQLVNIPHHEHSARDLHAGVTYNEIIMNSAGILKPGTKVSVLVGESRLENVIVQ